MSIFSKEYLQSTPTADLRIRLLDYQTHDGQYKELLREIVGREERANKRQLLIGVLDTHRCGVGSRRGWCCAAERLSPVVVVPVGWTYRLVTA